MGACACGYTTDPEKNCNGTHKVVKAVKEDLAEKLEANGFPHAAEYVRNNSIVLFKPQALAVRRLQSQRLVLPLPQRGCR